MRRSRESVILESVNGVLGLWKSFIRDSEDGYLDHQLLGVVDGSFVLECIRCCHLHRDRLPALAIEFYRDPAVVVLCDISACDLHP